MNTNLQEMVEYLAREEQAAKREVIELAQQMIQRLERVIRTVEQDGRPNSLGELQGSAATFDIACAAVTQAHKTVEMVTYFAGRENDVTA